MIVHALPRQGEVALQAVDNLAALGVRGAHIGDRICSGLLENVDDEVVGQTPLCEERHG